MPLDPVPTYPGQHDANEALNFPGGSEFRTEGDDHLRRLKASEKATWTNVTGPVTSSHDQLNALNDYVPASGTVEARLNALAAESAKFPGGGVVMLMFRNAVAAIPGWSQLTDVAYDDAMMRVINTATPGQGGSANPISMSGADVPTHLHAVSLSGDGEHNHGILITWTGGTGSNREVVQTELIIGTGVTPFYDNDASGIAAWIDPAVTHSHSGNTDNNSGPAAWEPKYFDVIIASKD